MFIGARQGVAIRTSAAVARVTAQGGRAQGVVLENGEELRPARWHSI
jgi:phytoene dehydrogenase-like protein